MIKAVIMDMDGLLVDSEPIWQEVAIEVFRTLRVPLTLEICQEATGLGTTEFVNYIYQRFPWQNKSLTEVGNDILELAHRQIAASAKEMPGATALVKQIYQRGIPLGVASASPMDIIETVLERLEIRSYFKVWHSALREKRNKPFPDVYLGAARLLGVDPSECLAFEDSGNGLQSAISAGMRTVAVPAQYEYTHPKFDKATLKIPSLNDFDLNIFNTLVQKL